MKRLKWAAVAAVAAALFWTGRTAPADDRLVPSVTVSGTGEVYARPDNAEIHAGVVTQAKTAAAALQANSEVMEKLLKTLAARNIDDKDIQTSRFDVSPQYANDPQGRTAPEIVGYQVTNMVRVRVRKLDMLGSVLDDVVGQGANHLEGISFGIAEPTQFLDEARQRAIADAQRKAALYAKAAGVPLGRPLVIQEQGIEIPSPRPFFGEMQRMAAVPVAAGEQALRATVSVTFALEHPTR